MVAVPLLYFGAQALAAPFLPGFDSLRHTASQLGSDLSLRPAILNTGALATGVVALLGAPGLAIGARRAGAARWLAAVTGLALASTGGAALWAGLHPLPDVDHAPGALGAGLFVLPWLATVLAWRDAPSRAMRVYLAGNVIAFAWLALVLSGATPLDPAALPGLWQRLLALVLHGPSAVLAARWLRRGVSGRPRPARSAPSARGTT